MSLEIGRLVGDHGKGSRVGFTERVPPERLGHLPDFIELLAGDAPLLGPLLEELAIDRKLSPVSLLCEDLAQVVGLLSGEIGQCHGDPRHVLLIDHDAVGLLEQFPDRGMEGFIGFAMEAFHVLGNEPVGGWSNDGRVNDEMFEIPHPGLFLEVSHGWRLHVEDPHGLASAHDLLSP